MFEATRKRAFGSRCSVIVGGWHVCPRISWRKVPPSRPALPVGVCWLD